MLSFSKSFQLMQCFCRGKKTDPSFRVVSESGSIWICNSAFACCLLVKTLLYSPYRRLDRCLSHLYRILWKTKPGFWISEDFKQANLSTEWLTNSFKMPRGLQKSQTHITHSTSQTWHHTLDITYSTSHTRHHALDITHLTSCATQTCFWYTMINTAKNF